MDGSAPGVDVLMKSVAITIPSRNNFEALPLCIESLLKFTDYPRHKIIVYDDASMFLQDGEQRPNLMDLGYLRACRDKGWLELIEGKEQKRHGGALNALLNERCKDEFDYAVVMDGDIQIKTHGWIQDLIRQCDKDPLNLGVCEWKGKGYYPRGYRPEGYLFCIGLINLALYRAWGRCDWSTLEADRRQEPYLSYFASLYPPEDNANFRHYSKDGSYVEFDRDKVIFDPSNTIAMKLVFDNPAGYRIVPEPPGFRHRYIHHIHAGGWLDPNNETIGGEAKRGRDEMLAKIKSEWRWLKGTAD
jgi:glycosyltransferase involved in cell wall biosynthesis